MSAISNVLKLLLIFEDDKNVVTSQELADEIGVSTRQIRSYISELRLFGYVIEGDATRGGGYKSAGQYVDIPLKITIDELAELGRTVNYFEKNNVFEEVDTLRNLYFKIKKYHKVKFKEKNQFDYRLQYQQIHEVGERAVLKKVCNAIENNNKLSIKYYSAKEISESIRIIHPYKVQFYQGANYIHAYCEKAQDYRVFKLLRIRETIILEEKFVRECKIEDKLQSQNFGIFTEPAKRIRLEFKYPYNEFAKELIIGEEQIFNIVDETTTILEATINNETELIGWIMSFGKDVRVLEPEELIAKIILQSNEINKMYSKKY